MQNSEQLNYIVNIWKLAYIFPFMYSPTCLKQVVKG